MPTFQERANSPSVVDNLADVDSATLTFWSNDDDDFATTYAAALVPANGIPASFSGLPLRSIGLDWNGEASLWDVTAEYGAVLDEGTTVEAFDTTGGTTHITQALSEAGRFPGTAPDFNGAIGVSGTTVEGVDIIAPQMGFTITQVKPASLVTTAYRTLLATYTGSVNLDSFRGYPAGEVLFAGATGSYNQIKQEWTITYRFLQSPNATNITVGSPPDQIIVPSKKGWEYLWVRYEEKEDTDAKKLVKRPIGAYVSRVYYSRLFMALGIT
jgi:hypothetical protein